MATRRSAAPVTAGDAKSSAESLVKRARDTAAATNKGLLALAAALYLLWVSGIEPSARVLSSALRGRKELIEVTSERDRYAKALTSKNEDGPDVTVGNRAYPQPVVERQIASAKVLQGRTVGSLASVSRSAEVSVKLGPIDLTVPLLFAPLLWLTIFAISVVWLLMARHEIIRLIGRSRRLCPDVSQEPITSRQLDDHPFWAHPFRFDGDASTEKDLRLLFGARHRHLREHAVGIAIAALAAVAFIRVTILAFRFARVFTNGWSRQGLQAATLALLFVTLVLLTIWRRRRPVPEYLPGETPPPLGVTRRQAMLTLGMAAIAISAPPASAFGKRVARGAPRFRHWPDAALMFEPRDLDVRTMTAWFRMTDGPLASLIKRAVTSPLSTDGRRVSVALCRELNHLLLTEAERITYLGRGRASRQTRQLASQKVDTNGSWRLARLTLTDNFPRTFPPPRRRRERVPKQARLQGLALDRLR